ncbi:tetratricopeptide repeat protein [Undibacterium sp. Rencai35W]|uniref:tetratricopeptide repeat protein n=1 Tax=Undibacterium sp. Rencai35W TaxID=3413046 RepID=UPI003BF02334
MKLIQAFVECPETSIFRVIGSEDSDYSNWEVEPLTLDILMEEEGFYIVKAKNILPDGKVQDCYLDISLLERINDLVYFFDGANLRVDYSFNFNGDVICAVPIDCFGVYELFYSKINPSVGIDILKVGLTNSTRKSAIAEDLGYIFRDEKQYGDAAKMFQISVDEGPSSYFLYGELAACYMESGQTEKGKEYERLFAQNNEMH